MYRGQLEKFSCFWEAERSSLTHDPAVCFAPSVPHAASKELPDRAIAESDTPRKNVRRLSEPPCPTWVDGADAIRYFDIEILLW